LVSALPEKLLRRIGIVALRFSGDALYFKPGIE
jgi:hypothetical protein